MPRLRPPRSHVRASPSSKPPTLVAPSMPTMRQDSLTRSAAQPLNTDCRLQSPTLLPRACQDSNIACPTHINTNCGPRVAPAAQSVAAFPARLASAGNRSNPRCAIISAPGHARAVRSRCIAPEFPRPSQQIQSAEKAKNVMSQKEPMRPRRYLCMEAICVVVLGASEQSQGMTTTPIAS